MIFGVKPITYLSYTMNKVKQPEKKYKVELTEKQIAIIKAGLTYCHMLDAFGGTRWYMETGIASTEGVEYKGFMDSIYEHLESVSPIKPDYGTWFHAVGLNDILADKLEEVNEKEI